MAEEGESEHYVSRGPVVKKVRKRRKDGWTRRDIDTFLGHLRVTGNISASAAAIGKSARSAHNLREIDADFAARWAGAMDEMEARIESKLFVFVETGGKTPVPRDDGEPAEPPIEDFDPHLAMQLLSHRRARREGARPKGGPRPKSASKEEFVQAAMTLLDMAERQAAKRS